MILILGRVPVSLRIAHLNLSTIQRRVLDCLTHRSDKRDDTRWIWLIVYRIPGMILCFLSTIQQYANTLDHYSVQTDIDLPQIAVIGNQSAGKSSLIEA